MLWALQELSTEDKGGVFYQQVHFFYYNIILFYFIFTILISKWNMCWALFANAIKHGWVKWPCERLTHGWFTQNIKSKYLRYKLLLNMYFLWMWEQWNHNNLNITTVQENRQELGRKQVDGKGLCVNKITTMTSIIESFMTRTLFAHIVAYWKFKTLTSVPSSQPLIKCKP